MSPVDSIPSPTLDARSAESRADIFAKTKMCKFNLMGSCAKGSACMFAHATTEMAPTPDLFRTKICKNLINTGFCEDKNCNYAHNKEELRTTSVVLRPKEGRSFPKGQKLQTASQKVRSYPGAPPKSPLLLPGKVPSGPLAVGALPGPAGIPLLPLPEAAALTQVPVPDGQRRRQAKAKREQLSGGKAKPSRSHHAEMVQPMAFTGQSEGSSLLEVEEDLFQYDERPLFTRTSSEPLPMKSNHLGRLTEFQDTPLMVMQESFVTDDELDSGDDMSFMHQRGADITVKNTFLEFQTRKTGALKTIRSCDGRLDAMGGCLLED